MKNIVVCFIDPPKDVNIKPAGSFETVKLKKDFGKYVLNTSADSYDALSCNSAIITWVSPKLEIYLSCQAEGGENFPV